MCHIMDGKKLENFLKYELENINKHLPRKRIPLNKGMKENTYVSKGNDKISIDPREIQFLQSLCPKDKLNSVYLPIIIVRRRDLGEGAYIISGESIEEFLVLKAINKWEGDWSEFLKEKEKRRYFYLYKPDLLEIRKKLSTCTVIAFS